MKNQEQVLKALSGLVPEDAQKEVNEAISSFLENAKTELHGEFETKLKEAYEQHQKEIQEATAVAEEGYKEAWSTITDLRNRLTTQKEELDRALDEGYEEAYKMLEEEKAKNDTLEVDLYEEYDKKFNDVKEFLVEKLDQFLKIEGEKFYEAAKRDVMNDPAVVEHKLAFEKILDIAADYLSEEDYAFATNSKVDQLHKNLEESKAQMKILEGKNIRLSMENTKLNENVRQKQETINESANKNDKKERVEKAKKVEGRGELVEKECQVVIGENTTNAGEPVAESTEQSVLFEDWKQMAGLKK